MKNFPNKGEFEAYLLARGQRRYFSTIDVANNALAAFLRDKTGKRYVVAIDGYGPIGRDKLASVPGWVSTFVRQMITLESKWISVGDCLKILGVAAS